jgi:DNA mismatch endonuclease (patch repair protein)
MLATGRRDTPCELAVRAHIHRLGFRYRVDYPPLAQARFRADLVFPRVKVAVFVDGCFWHGCPRHGSWPKANSDWWRAKIEANRTRDAAIATTLRAAGWTVLRVWEHEDAKAAAARVADVLRTKRGGATPNPSSSSYLTAARIKDSSSERVPRLPN